MNDFADTAVIIQFLDLVITIDTAAAHLAGALGKPVWTLLPFSPDWRWMRDRPDSPWYPTMRLFRQSQPGDWTGVFVEMEAVLRFTLAQRYQAGPDNEGKLQHREQALALNPNYNVNDVKAYIQLGLVLGQQRKLTEALGYFRQAIALAPNSVYGHFCLGTALLLSGDLQQGFAEHEWRWQFPGFARPIYHFSPAPLWDGSPFPGQTILLYSESGLGDAIQFIRYAPLVKQLGDKVIVACSPALKRLFSTIPEIEDFIEDPPSSMPEHHLRARIMSLPYLLGTTTEEKIPAQVPYLHAREENEAIKSLLPQTSDKLKVGIVCAPRPQALDYASRGCDIQYFIQLLSLPDITLYSLQKGVSQPPQANAKNLIFLGDKLNDLADTAAIIQELDLVITVDTSVAHLAGALAKPVWTLLAYSHDWRWMLDREDSPWYPTMRLFRQSQPGDWTGVFVEVKAALVSFIASRELDVPGRTALNPNHNVDERELTNRALVAYKEGRLTAAAQLCQEIIRQAPENTEALNLMGAIAHGNGKLEESADYFSQVLQLQPDHVEAHSHLGVVFREQGKLTEASGHFQQALALEPNQPKNHIGLGIVLYEQGKLDAAITHYQQALALQAHIPLVYKNLAIALQTQGKLELSLTYIRQAIALQPDYVEAYHNLGNILNLMGKLEEAVDAYQQALVLKPDYPEAHNNLAYTLKKLGKFSEALGHFQQALGQCPDDALVHNNLGMLLLLLGEMKQGFAECEWRWQCGTYAQEKKSIYAFKQPLWDGSLLEGRTILLYCEQGMGDAIQFIRYVPLVEQRGGKVIVECLKPLLRLFSTVPGLDRLVEKGTPRPEFDVQASLMTLPHILGTTLDTIPAQIPYLRSDSPSEAL